METKSKQTFAQVHDVAEVTMGVASMVIQLAWQDRHVPILVSESGIGKTAVSRAIAQASGADYVLMSLAHCEPPDISGPQFPSGDQTYVTLRDGRIPFKGFEGENRRAVIHADEPNRAEMPTLNAAFPMWAERRLGTHELGPNVRVVSSMNPPDDEYAVTSQFTSDPAMRRRMCIVAVMHSPQETLAFARRTGQAEQIVLPWMDWTPEVEAVRAARPWHPALVEYLTGYPDVILDTASRDAGKVYGCPATWEQVSDTLYTADRIAKAMPALVESAVWNQALQAKVAGHVGMSLAPAVLKAYATAIPTIDPIVIATSLHKDKAARASLVRLVDRGEIGEIMALCNRVAAIWKTAAVNADPEDRAGSIAEFVSVTPTQVAKNMINLLATATGPRGLDAKDREYSIALASHPKFIAWRQEVASQVHSAVDSIRTAQ